MHLLHRAASSLDHHGRNFTMQARAKLIEIHEPSRIILSLESSIRERHKI